MREKRGESAIGPRTFARTAQRGTQVALLLFAFGGCGSAAEEEPKRDSPEKDFATYVDLYADMVCGVVARCCNELNQAVYTLGGDETCKDVVETEVAISQIGTFGSMGAKTSVYHEDRQRACAAALEAASCDELDAGWPAACEDAWFDGTVPVGATCDTSSECIDSYCLRPATARKARKELIHLFLGPWPDVPKGTCVAPLGDGADCVEDHECQSSSCEDGMCEVTPSSLEALCPI